MMRGAATVVCLMVGVMLTAAGCSGKGKAETVRESPRVVKGIAVESVRTVPIPNMLEAVGTVRATNAAVIAARIPGTITALHVREGDRVAKGKLLLTLEAAETAAGAAGAQAAVIEAERGVDEAKAHKRLADATFERYQKLFSEQAVTRQEFDNRQTEQEVAVQGLALAEARLTQAREGARAAGTMAGYTRVTSPISGVITAKAVDVGMTIFPGSQLMTVEEEGRYRLEVSAPENLLGKVKLGEEVAVAIDGTVAGTKGRVAEVVPMVDPMSRTFTVKLDLPAKGLRSGQYGRASFPVGTGEGILVANGVLVERGPLTSVWVVGKDNVARMRLVKVGRRLGEKAEILSGLSDGERIVVNSVEKVSDGVSVE